MSEAEVTKTVDEVEGNTPSIVLDEAKNEDAVLKTDVDATPKTDDVPITTPTIPDVSTQEAAEKTGDTPVPSEEIKSDKTKPEESKSGATVVEIIPAEEETSRAMEAEQNVLVNAPIEDPSVTAQNNTSDAMNDVNAAVDELLQDKELESRENTQTTENSDERSKDVDTTDLTPTNTTTETRSSEPELESRGEDRNEGPKAEPEGRGDDPKSDEEVQNETTLGDQTAQKKALQQLIDEKTKLEKELFSVKDQLGEMKTNYSKIEVEVDTINTSRKEKDEYIKTLEHDVIKLKEYEDWGKDNESKVKTVQNKLKSLAEVEEMKNKKIFELEKQLAEAKEKLLNVEKNIEDKETSSNRAEDEKPKSRTCTLM